MNKETEKKVIRWRLRQGELYGKITTDFDPRGVVVFTPNVEEASTWACEYHAKLIVDRTRQVQEWVRRSSLAGWAKFERLMVLTAPAYESFELTPAEALELAANR